MKKGLIGISNNVKSNKDKIRVWSESFKRYVPDGEVILLVANSTEEDIDAVRELGINYKIIDINIDPWYINNLRLIHTSEYLRESDIDLFMVTDVFDVIFQSNPFDKFDTDNYDFFVGGEGITVNEEPWNKDVLNKCFPTEVNHCVDTEIVCSGVMGGKRESLIPILEKMYDMCINSETNHNIRDQAALIILISKNEIERIKIFNLNDGLAMHCASSGPTEFLDGWGMGGTITNRYGGIPKMVDGVVCTHEGHTYDIAHQFNRIPEWHEILLKPYE